MNLYDTVETSTFEDIEARVQALDYKYDITKPTETELGKINIYNNNNNDYVYLGFYPNKNSNDIETLVTVSYTTDKKEISVSNEFFTSKVKYSTHILGESSKTVNNVDDLKTFMFKE